MLYLIWSILNGIVFIYFLYLIIGFITKGKRIFKPPFKVVSIIILIIGISQIFFGAKAEKHDNHIVLVAGNHENNTAKTERLVLEENLTFDIKLFVTYAKEQDVYKPLEGFSTLTGFVMGYQWEFQNFDANSYKPNETATYTASGTLKWNLFGITIYSESKTFNGIIK